MSDNLELLSIKCPHCDEVSPTKQWITMGITTTSGFASFSFGGKPKDSYGLMCPKCKLDCKYQDLIDALKSDT